LYRNAPEAEIGRFWGQPGRRQAEDAGIEAGSRHDWKPSGGDKANPALPEAKRQAGPWFQAPEKSGHKFFALVANLTIEISLMELNYQLSRGFTIVEG
jgi:hypothetical protein